MTRKERLAAEEKEWEETLIILLQSLGKVVKTFLTFNSQEKR